MRDDAGPPRIPDACLAALPIFPLPDVHLFPHALLPLHVFEPRYRALMSWVLAHDRALGIATLKPGYASDYHGAPAVYEIMGAGVVLAAEAIEDGRWNCIVRGTTRIRIVEELATDHPFRVVRAERLVEADVGDHPLGDRLRSLVTQLAESAPDARRALTSLLAQAEGAAGLVDLISAHTVGDGALRRQLLEEVDVVARLDLACDYLSRIVLEVGKPPDTIH